MEGTTIRDEAAAFFDRFVDAFHTFDGAEIARRYLSPYQSLSADGTVECFDTDEATAGYFQAVVDEYYQDGCRSCRYGDLEAVAVGPSCILATVTWELTGKSGDMVASWRESYNIARTADGLRIFASIDH